MGNFFSSIGSWFEGWFDWLGSFFTEIAIWFVDLWADFTFAFYVCEDLIIVLGPFIGFLLYALMTPAKTEVDNKIVVNVDLEDVAGI